MVAWTWKIMVRKVVHYWNIFLVNKNLPFFERTNFLHSCIINIFRYKLYRISFYSVCVVRKSLNDIRNSYNPILFCFSSFRGIFILMVRFCSRDCYFNDQLIVFFAYVQSKTKTLQGLCARNILEVFWIADESPSFSL